MLVHGIVSKDRSSAIFAAAALDSLYPDAAGRLKLRGLDPEAAYLVEPVFPGASFHGSVLANVGVAAPRIHPDQVVLYRITRRS